MVFGVLFCVVAAFILTVAVVTVRSIVRDRRALRAAGVDPSTIEAEVHLRRGTLQQRLAELDDLHSRGVISQQEHAAARARVLG